MCPVLNGCHDHCWHHQPLSLGFLQPLLRAICTTPDVPEALRKDICVLLYSVVMHVHKGHRVTPKAFRDQSHGMNVMAQGWVSIALSISLCVTVLAHANTCSVSAPGATYTPSPTLAIATASPLSLPSHPRAYRLSGVLCLWKMNSVDTREGVSNRL